jgi:hypothetical protein
LLCFISEIKNNHSFSRWAGGEGGQPSQNNFEEFTTPGHQSATVNLPASAYVPTELKKNIESKKDRRTNWFHTAGQQFIHQYQVSGLL